VQLTPFLQKSEKMTVFLEKPTFEGFIVKLAWKRPELLRFLGRHVYGQGVVFVADLGLAVGKLTVVSELATTV
jgi:hypothetical protein